MLYNASVDQVMFELDNDLSSISINTCKSMQIYYQLAILNYFTERCYLNSIIWHNECCTKFLYDMMKNVIYCYHISWWRHHMETFFALLAICAGNSPVTGELPAQKPVTRSFFYLRLNKRLSKQWWGWWFEMPSHSLWHHCNMVSTVPG